MKWLDSLKVRFGFTGEQKPLDPRVENETAHVEDAIRAVAEEHKLASRVLQSKALDQIDKAAEATVVVQAVVKKLEKDEALRVLKTAEAMLELGRARDTHKK